jgi:uncharacterized iron-regulated protein
MKRRSTWFAACLLAVLSVTVQAQGLPEHAIYAGSAQRSFEHMVAELARADVVFVGENHDHDAGHALEFAILKALYATDPRLALSVEMFERDVQGVVDEYLGGFITETHFMQSSRPWPNYKTDYRPLVEFCKEKKLPVIAANAPRRYVNIVGRSGQQALAALPKASRESLPRLPYAMDIPAGYDKMLSDLFGGQHGQGGTAANMPPPERMKEAQGLWDATMADAILRCRRANRGVKVVQMNGAGHSDSGWGIVDRLRKADRRLKIAVVSIKPEAAFPQRPAGTYDGVADFLILTPAEKP